MYKEGAEEKKEIAPEGNPHHKLRIYSKNEALYLINLDVTENQTPLIINSNGTVSKYRVEIIIYFEIQESTSENIIYNNVSRGFSEYLVQTSEIQTNEKFKQAKEIAANDAVQMMKIKIQNNISRTQ